MNVEKFGCLALIAVEILLRSATKHKIATDSGNMLQKI